MAQRCGCGPLNLKFHQSLSEAPKPEIRHQRQHPLKPNVMLRPSEAIEVSRLQGNHVIVQDRWRYDATAEIRLIEVVEKAQLLRTSFEFLRKSLVR